MAIIKCKECGADISSEARTCPHCGCPSKKEAEYQKYADTNSRIPGIIIGIIILIIGLCLAFSSAFNLGYGG